jgi:cytochrome P450
MIAPSLKPLPQPLRLSPWQQWQLISQPRTFTAWLREHHGPLVNLRIKGEPFVILLTAEGARDVLSADPLGYDAFFKESFTGLTGPGSLWVMGGEVHRRERQIFLPAFHARGYRAYGDTIRAIAREHVARWQVGRPMRALDATLAISLDVVMGLVFGAEAPDVRRQGGARLSALLHTVNAFIVFVPDLQRRWFPPWRRYTAARAAFWAWVDQVIAERRARRVEADDVLDRMLAARYDDGRAMSDAAIRDELLTILLAGHETTATALAWALYEVGRHPDVLRRLREEIAGVWPAADPGTIARLPYLSAVCDETLRAHTLLAEVPRLCVAPLACLGRYIPAGHAVDVSIMAIHHDPDLYPEPDAFRPERFLERSYSAFEFLPFGGGDRRCLGAGLSDYEMRLVLAEVVQHWEFKPAADERDIRHDIAMGPKAGVPLRLTGRYTPQGDGLAAVHERLHA